MKLAPAEVFRFYSIWFPLLYFVSRQRDLVPHFPAVYNVPHNVSTEEAAQLRDALWADDGLRKTFIAENPAGLGAADLALVASWDFRVTGTFYFFRQLKKHAILIPERGEPKVYAVLGLASSFEDSVPIPPPYLLSTTLLPFEGKIIYDGIMRGYNVYFGSGIRSSLNESYKAAQERGRVITSLDDEDVGATPEAIRARNAKLLTLFRKQITRANTSPQTLERHRATIDRFAEEYLLRQSPPCGLIEMTAEDLARYLGAMGDDVNLTSFKHFARFLRDTGRIPWEEAEAILDELRG